MKKLTLSLVAIAAMSRFASAGGDIAPVEPVVEVPAPVIDSGFYVGIAYSAVNASSEYEGTDNINDSWTWSGEYEEDYDAAMLQVGYKINQYLAVEARYWESGGDVKWTNEYEAHAQGSGQTIEDSWKNESGTYTDAEFTAWGIYVKPMYPVTEVLDIYALLGYGNNTISYNDVDEFDENGFQWGVGASYELTEHFAIFADYVHMHSDEVSSTDSTGGNRNRNGSAWLDSYSSDDTVYTLNFGLTYKF
jgi:opacity protein-like surface antigen